MTIAYTPQRRLLGQVTTLAAPAGHVVLLTRSGYVTVPLDSVRLVEV